MSTRRHHHLNLLWVAFLALAGLMAVGRPAKACAAIKVPKACCEAGPAADCRCCDPSELSGPAHSEGVEWTVPSAAASLNASRAGTSCECLANVPPAPAPKPDSRTSDESRTDQGHDEVIAYLAFAPRPFMPAFRLTSANVSQPKSPLYLRTLHLLV